MTRIIRVRNIQTVMCNIKQKSLSYIPCPGSCLLYPGSELFGPGFLILDPWSKFSDLGSYVVVHSLITTKSD